MSIIAIGSLRASPGATTLAIALAASWSRAGRTALVLEADPDGGVIAARHGLAPHPSLTDLAVRARGGLHADDLDAVAQPLVGAASVVVAPRSADQCHATLRNAGPAVAGLLRDLPGRDVLVDTGRLRPRSPSSPLIEAADIVLVVLRPCLEEVAAAAARLPEPDRRATLGLVLVGRSPYRADDVASALDVPVIGVVPVDSRGAGSPSSRRQPLMRAARTLAADLVRRLEAEVP